MNKSADYYNRDKGLDFIARFNNKYIIGEAKFLTDFGGHQNAQFSDAIEIIKSNTEAINIAILDGVLIWDYIVEVQILLFRPINKESFLSSTVESLTSNQTIWVRFP